MKKFWAFYVPFFIFIVALSALLIVHEKAELHLWFTSFHTGSRDFFYKYYTEAGGSVPFVVAAALLFYRYKATLFVLLGQGLTALVIRIGKLWFNEPRPKVFFSENFPDIVLHSVEGVRMHSWQSFPSGHTGSAFAFFLCLALMSNNKIIHFLCLVLAVLAGYSRIYLSQHFAADVLAGSIIAVTVVTLCYIFIFEKKPMLWANGSLRDVVKKRPA